MGPCDIDRAGPVVLEYILCAQQQTTLARGEVQIPGLVVVAIWYLWWERPRAVNGNISLGPERAARLIDAMYGVFLATNTRKARMKKGGWVSR
jgi:hypothetical protein